MLIKISPGRTVATQLLVSEMDVKVARPTVPRASPVSITGLGPLRITGLGPLRCSRGGTNTEVMMLPALKGRAAMPDLRAL
ncbi:hypothetical protein ACFPIJ_57460 [Dactylosporangium cerinum]|uniref:Uncharacterized protein n=1 Tax=Dactylosporangium cerinum TaxID=1434730 RepID=A0ABV9WJE4_9ACTN